MQQCFDLLNERIKEYSCVYSCVSFKYAGNSVKQIHDQYISLLKAKFITSKINRIHSLHLFLQWIKAACPPLLMEARSVEDC